MSRISEDPPKIEFNEGKHKTSLQFYFFGYINNYKHNIIKVKYVSYNLYILIL